MGTSRPYVRPMLIRHHRRRLLAGAAALTLLVTLTACGDDGGSDDAAGAGEDSEAAGDPIVLGYSAWPGWFPLAIAEQEGLFEEAGVEVELRFFADYIGSLDAMAAGEIDGNTQTLNDPRFGVAAGDEQTIVVTNDNSTGNDAIICDGSITSIEDLEGKTVAAEPGVVDHFLLLQGLESVGLTEDDIELTGLPTDAAAASFAAGEVDCAGVFAPFTLTALEREGSAVLFDSADFPGTISDHIVVTPELIEERPEDVQALVDAWYLTLDWMEENPDEALEILAETAELTPEEYETFADGTTLFSVEDALAAFEDGDDTTSLQHTAELINPFLVEAGLTEEEAPLDGLFDPSFTQDYADRQG
jgi:NitT/TauT family transport system substrate-binding protein